MSVLGRAARALYLLAPLLLWSTAAGGASADSTQIATDSTKVSRFSPTSASFVRASDVDMSLGSGFDVMSNPGNGWLIMNSVSMERRILRGRDNNQSLTENLRNQAKKDIPGLFAFNFNVGESYNRTTSQGLGQLGKEIIVNNQTASLNFRLAKPILNATTSSVSFHAGGRRGRNDFKYDRSLNGSISSSLNYVFREMVKIGGGYGTTRRRESSDVGSRSFGAMPTSADTVRAVMYIGKEGAKLINLAYKRSTGEERRVTPARGNALEVIDDPSKAKQERIRTNNEDLSVTSSLRPLPFLSLTLQLDHEVNGQVFAVESTLTKKNRSDVIYASSSYQYATKGALTVDVRSSRTVDDFGPISLSSYRERENVLSASLSHKINDSLSISLSGSGSLKQRFFLKSKQNPQDADYLYYKGEFTLKASPFRRITTSVSGLMDRQETINIDPSQSGDNRVNYQYRVIPQFTLRPVRWVSISQDYTIKIDYTDFVFSPEKNILNRTTMLNTRADFVLWRPLTFAFKHAYFMKDTGTYLDYSGRRLYDPNNQNVEHSLLFDMRYDPIPDFGVRAQADFKTQRTNSLRNVGGRSEVTKSTLFDSGGMMVGFSRKKRIGEYGDVNLDIAYNRRYGPYLTAERREFWNVNSEVILKF